MLKNQEDVPMTIESVINLYNIMNKEYKTRIYESISEKIYVIYHVLFFVKIDIYNYISI